MALPGAVKAQNHLTEAWTREAQDGTLHLTEATLGPYLKLSPENLPYEA